MADRRRLHLCIATGQNLANLIPALQCGADEVWILRTPTMHASAKHLADALKRRDIRIKQIDFPETGVSSFDAEAVKIASDLAAKNADVVVNITGGTKLMALTLVQTLAEWLDTGPQRASIVYTDTERAVLEWLRPEVRSEPMEPVLRVDDVLRVNGYERDVRDGHTEEAHGKWLDIARDRAELTRTLAESVPTNYLEAASKLNYLASATLRKWPTGGSSPVAEFSTVPRGPSAEYLRLLEDESLIVCDHGTHITFNTREAARYCAGGWLEEFAALKTEAAISLHGEWRANVQVDSAENRTRNEIDLVIVHDNRTLVVECKAAKTDEDDVINWIAKLKEFAERVAGNQSTPLLLSVRDLTEIQRKRAADSGVRVCCGQTVARFSKVLHDWMRTPR